MTPWIPPNTSVLLTPWTFTINDIQAEKKGWNANIILEDKFTFLSQHRNLIKVLWCYGYLITLKAELEFNSVPYTEELVVLYFKKFLWKSIAVYDTPNTLHLKDTSENDKLLKL